MTNVSRTLSYALLAALGALVVSPRTRSALRDRSTDLTPFLLVAIGFAVVMSLGPVPDAPAGNAWSGLALYQTFFELAPGFAGLRAPARFGMVAGCLLAALGGYALARLARWPGGAGPPGPHRRGVPRRGLRGADAREPELDLERAITRRRGRRSTG